MDEKINQLHSKTEQAQAMGITVPKDGDWGNMPSRVCGEVGGAQGGNFTREAVKKFENKLVQKDMQ
ncbi:small, acid-soluble spore protein, alpha/beta type [Clostridium thermarum]|uniref:small, acid-soluble spore protein, alpha/beta type n=1 Tax=Clostridium thermarum TaxID=1716543 RepID=UPI0011248E0A|nr:small, acid-soluble spore protein, alpha/beta type [Clostridium thermarum]